MKNEYLTMEQVDIPLKCYYLKRYTIVAKMENSTVNKIMHRKYKALKYIRKSCGRLFLQKQKFDGKMMLERMAVHNGLTVEELTEIFNQYILEGLQSDSKKYWQRIRSKGDIPTADELLDFIYNKFEIDIF